MKAPAVLQQRTISPSDPLGTLIVANTITIILAMVEDIWAHVRKHAAPSPEGEMASGN
ncbi:MAG: hypothetical protein LUQ62_00655 [Methanomicrobiales archaeon]|nr:hypothetical protein [Methanomicrobiales archaeon]